jgi:hypothetical protein
MRSAPCPRSFEVEASRDGRLTGAALASFERHMTGCAACSREFKALEGLANALRTDPRDGAGADSFHARRERTRLLAAFDRTLVAPDNHSGARRWLLSSAAVAALIACALVLWRVRSPEQTAHAAAIVHADSTAVWSERRDGGREKIVLERGGLWIHVDHSSGEGGLLVVLPDGELDDTGTTFTVLAEEGRTTRVSVEEGTVVLRIRGEGPVAVGAGGTWVAEARLAASSRASSATPAGIASSEPLSPSPPAASVLPRASAPPALAPDLDPSADFRAAMSALDVGDNAEAVARFASFLVKHPRDPRAEDAAYLRVIALQRTGDTGRMKQAAQEYLERYPAGFRHSEMEALSR